MKTLFVISQVVHCTLPACLVVTLHPALQSQSLRVKSVLRSHDSAIRKLLDKLRHRGRKTGWKDGGREEKKGGSM